jgi:PST family polysaccharide transporter
MTRSDDNGGSGADLRFGALGEAGGVSDTAAAGETAADVGVPGRSHTGLRRQVFRGGAFLAARQAIGMVVSTTGMLLLTRQIGPQNYGLFIASIGVFAYFNFVAQFGLDVYLIRREGPTEDRDFHLGFTLLLILGVGVSTVGLLGAPLLQRWAGVEGITPLVRALFAGLPIGLLVLIPGARMERALDYRRLAIIELANVFVMQGTSLSMAYAFGLGAWSPVIGWWAQQLVSVTLLYAISGYRPRLAWDAQRIKAMLSYGLGYAASIWIWQLRSLVNPLIVLPQAGPAAVAYVGLGMKFVEVLSFVKTTTWRLSIAALAKLDGDRGRTMTAINEGMRLQMLALGPLLAGFAVLAPYVLPLAFHGRWAEWKDSLTIYPYLAAGVLANALFSLHSSVLYVLRRNLLVATFHAVHVVLYFVAASLFVKRFGVIGVGYAEFVALASYVVIHLFTLRVTGASPDYAVPTAWAVAIGMLLFVHQIGWPAWLGVAAAAAWPRTWHTLESYLRLIRPAPPAGVSHA